MKINGYDFDKTIYDGDSTVDFYQYCLWHHIGILKALPMQVWGFILYAIGVIKKTKFKQYFYTFLKYLKNVDQDVENFWKAKEANIKKWYQEKEHQNDVIISASPEFLLTPICKKMRSIQVDCFKSRFENGFLYRS